MENKSQPWSGAAIVPLLVIEDPAQTEPLVGALVEGGLNLVEIALRTPGALHAIELAANTSGVKVAAGTVVRAEQFEQVRNAGAEFAVSPAFTSELADAAQAARVPWIPGIGSVSEALEARGCGFHHLKIYPADLLGGPGFVASLSAVFQDLTFMPSGGVSEQNFVEYISLPSVAAVSGSWIAPKQLISQGEFALITERAHRACEAIK